jgi:hypothetical protein
LTGSLARLQWQIDVYWDSECAFQVFLDATDIPLGNAVSGIYIHDPIYADAMLAGFKGQESQIAGLDDQHFFPAFTRAVKQRRDDYESHLNSMYGTLRAPNHIKENEVSRNGKGTNKTAKNSGIRNKSVWLMFTRPTRKWPIQWLTTHPLRVSLSGP